MKTEIYFFSGTGNTLFLAKEIAKSISGKVIPIASLRNENKLKISTDAIGIVFPVYYGNVPVIVKDFVKKLKNISDKYIFAVSNYGGASSLSYKTIRDLICNSGGELSLFCGFHMPQNAFRKPWENQEKVIYKAKNRVQKIVKYIKNRKKGKYLESIILEGILYPFFFNIQTAF